MEAGTTVRQLQETALGQQLYELEWAPSSRWEHSPAITLRETPPRLLTCRNCEITNPGHAAKSVIIRYTAREYYYNALISISPQHVGQDFTAALRLSS